MDVRKLARPRALALSLSAIAVIASVAAKLSLTSGELLPGVDGAYYWVQVRSILDDFTLAFDDLPLVFWIQALFAFLLGDIKLGVRISDAFLPALSAIPIYLIFRRSKSSWVPAVAILAVLVHPIQLYFFTGDFIKNSTSIPVVFFIAWILFSWTDRSKLKSSLYLLLCLSVLAFSHFGTLLMAILLIFFWLIFMLRKKPIKFWAKTSAIACGSAFLVLVALSVLAPSKFERLIRVVSQPTEIFENASVLSLFSPFVSLIFGGQSNLVLVFTMLSGQLGSIVLGVITWRLRKQISESSLGLIVAGLFSAFSLSSPLIGMEWSIRLTAISFVPLAISAMVIWLESDRKQYRVIPAILALTTLTLSLLLSFSGARPPIANTSEYSDLKKVFQSVTLPEGSIVVARHGLEFLVAWEAHVYVVQEQSYEDENLERYAAVYFLTGANSHEAEKLGTLVYKNATFALKQIR